MDVDLVRKINSGTCFAFVGSGPSIEIGYMSWRNLAINVFREIQVLGINFDIDSYEKYLRESKLPELFGFASRLLGGKAELVEIIKKILPPQILVRGNIYEYICRWPFACYLTTNFDDEISRHLAIENVHYATIMNRKEDFAYFRNAAYGVIAKVHSDLKHPESVVLTDQDYSYLYSRSSAIYFRKKMQQIFEMFDMLIIGYSLADKDIGYILEDAKETASPEHPIYMIIANVTPEDESEFFRKYNIRIIKYHDTDGKHSELQNILRRYDPFIFGRNKIGEREMLFSKPNEKLDAAISLFLYQRLQGHVGVDHLSPLILAGMASSTDTEMSIDKLLAIPIIKQLLGELGNGASLISGALDLLESKSFVTKLNDRYQITDSGKASVYDIESIRNIQKDQAYGQFKVDILADNSQVSEEDVNRYMQLAEQIIITSFEKRGITLANQVYAGTPANPQEVSDIFEYISLGASQIKDSIIKTNFIIAMHRFLVEPSQTQREYLMSISQGYFIYHLLGLDPDCANARRDIFTHTLWICDSSILLPFIALGCHDYAYASDLFRKLKENNAQLMTTNKIIAEIWGHYYWAQEFIKLHPGDYTELLRMGLVQGSYTQNLFIDGYIRMCGNGEIRSFREYTDSAFPKGVSVDSIRQIIQNMGIFVGNLHELIGFDNSTNELEIYKKDIETARLRKGTFRSINQVDTEAEIFSIIDGLRNGRYRLNDDARVFDKFYFVSHSRVLDHISSKDDLISWHPESLYRYLVSLPWANEDPNLLQQCMLNSYFYAGVPYIDEEKYLRFFGSTIRESKLKYESEKEEYARLLEKNAESINDTFYSLPDLEKPFFVEQMGWKMARMAEKETAIAKSKMHEAESIAALLRQEKNRNWKKKSAATLKQEEATKRNKMDPKHAKKLARQAKKRRKKLK